MENSEPIKNLVRQKYGEIALQKREADSTSCCGSKNCSTEIFNLMSDDYSHLKGYNPDADLGLGCGLPTEFAKIRKGNVVIDLGSGAGNDCFVARTETGEDGQIIGIDFTPAMIEKARANAQKLGYSNVEFLLGDIENMPVPANVADVIISNCVLNLVPNKNKVFQEIFRVLKPGGHFSISDIVWVGKLPENLRKDAEMYAGCVSGAIQKKEYLELIRANGFTCTTIQKEKPIHLPENLVRNRLKEEEQKNYHMGNMGIFSITVYAEKPKNEAQSFVVDKNI